MDKIKVLLSAERPNNYAQALQQCGADSLLDVNDLTNINGKLKADGLLLCGGGDPLPCLYSQPNTSSNCINAERDIRELFLIKKFLSENKPILGICRGMQIINVFFGGSLFQNVKNDFIHSRKLKPLDKVHTIMNKQNSFMYRLYGKKTIVASAHHQSIDRLGKNLIACSFSLDNECEAVFNDNIIAVQFHPERMNKSIFSDGLLIYSYFVKIILKNIINNN